MKMSRMVLASLFALLLCLGGCFPHHSHRYGPPPPFHGYVPAHRPPDIRLRPGPNGHTPASPTAEKGSVPAYDG